MMRLAFFALLGGSFLTVQAHAVRERAVAASSSCVQLAAQPPSQNGRDSSMPGLGGGTTRALQEAWDPRWTSPATPSLAPRLPIARSLSQSNVAPAQVPPDSGAAPPILRI
jgi:hypothetical protein